MTTPEQSAINLMVSFAEDAAETPSEVASWREFGAILDADGTLDGRDEHDAKHAP